MALTDTLLTVLRFWLYATASGLAFLELILDAVALAAMNDKGPYTTDVFTYYGPIGWSEEKGAAGWTMFVTIVTLFLIPTVLFARFLVSRGIGFAHHTNKTGIELAITTTVTVFWLVAGAVMANYAGTGGCNGSSLCAKFRAATAFAWLIFFDLAAALVFLIITAVRQKKAGANLMVVYTVDQQGEGTGLPYPVTYANQATDKGPEYPSQGEMRMPQP
ncbi:hypothetical protein FBU59_000723 [Linderina macrospora]|uniref:Uncharacterized protein n=1 Tax=Linderina macrospora TaxID=4868 RepID=A0ACC1JG93_9FUNG|nr:hypothetical protein FBU59_000723 [Linderina macrospora]